MPEDRSLSFDFSPKPVKPVDEEPRPLTVAELDRAVKDAIDGTFVSPVWVEGEVADARPASSGHLYFCLKDEREEASIEVVAYRSNVTPRMRQLCIDGARVRLRGKPTLWAPRGRLQLVADRLQAAGRGALLEAIERLKAKLLAEGLFEPARKRPLPREPRRIGVVTSSSGAAIHDVCRVAFRRGGARILLAAAQVQGAGAAESVCRALSQLQRVSDVDVIVIGRGGGSADDLGAFNEEAVVRAVAACRVPIVSAVGHDVDVTLVDFAADARAATPSQAAELVVPDRRARRELLRRTGLHLARAMHGRLAQGGAALARVAGRLGDPRLAIAAHQQTLDERDARLAARMRASLARGREALSRMQRRLAYLHPRAVVARNRADFPPRRPARRGLRRGVREAGVAAGARDGAARRPQPAQRARARIRHRDARGRPGGAIERRRPGGRGDPRARARGAPGRERRSGRTAGEAALKAQRFAVIGDPVAHSKSPSMQAAAFQALGLAHTYEALRVTADELPGVVAMLRGGTYDGLNVTVPHKERVLSLVEVLAPSAKVAGPANMLVRGDDGRVVRAASPRLGAGLERRARARPRRGRRRARGGHRARCAPRRARYRRARARFRGRGPTGRVRPDRAVRRRPAVLGALS